MREEAKKKANPLYLRGTKQIKIGPTEEAKRGNRMKFRVLATATGCLLSLTILVSNCPAEAAKHYTITQRQEMLNKEVTAGLKANELTLKEANKLKDRLTDVTNHIAKMKEKNAGKLSYKDEGKVEKDLNAISVDMQKEKLEKRVQSK
jgi:hypothetical protein